MQDPLYIGIRFALYADLMLIFGLPLFTLYTRGGRSSLAASRSVMLCLTLVGLMLSIASIVAMTASMAGIAFLDVDRTSAWAMISQTPMGAAWAVRLCVLALLITSLVASHRHVIFAVLGALALASLAWTGHGAAGEGNPGTVELIADIVHLLAAGAWLGALAGLGRMLWARDDPAATQRALEGFAPVGTLIVAAIVGSGVVNGIYLVGWSNLGRLPSTLYGQLLLFKLALFGGMLALAAVNRFRLTPALESAQGLNADNTRRALSRSLMLETAVALAILGLVAWLGTLEPTGAVG